MNENKDQDISEIKKRIWSRVKALEKTNYAQKPDGLRDREMVERIQKIIEQEVNKCL